MENLKFKYLNQSVSMKGLGGVRVFGHIQDHSEGGFICQLVLQAGPVEIEVALAGSPDEILEYCNFHRLRIRDWRAVK